MKWSRLPLIVVCKMIIPTERDETKSKRKNIAKRKENIQKLRYYITTRKSKMKMNIPANKSHRRAAAIRDSLLTRANGSSKQVRTKLAK
jgi:hypothetical protein